MRKSRDNSSETIVYRYYSCDRRKKVNVNIRADTDTREQQSCSRIVATHRMFNSKNNILMLLQQICIGLLECYIRYFGLLLGHVPSYYIAVHIHAYRAYSFYCQRALNYIICIYYMHLLHFSCRQYCLFWLPIALCVTFAYCAYSCC